MRWMTSDYHGRLRQARAALERKKKRTGHTVGRLKSRMSARYVVMARDKEGPMYLMSDVNWLWTTDINRAHVFTSEYGADIACAEARIRANAVQWVNKPEVREVV